MPGKSIVTLNARSPAVPPNGSDFGWRIHERSLLGLGLLIVHLLSTAASSGGVVEIPATKRIEAHIARTLSAPAEKPMHMPTDVAVDDAGRVFVADGANDRIVRFTPDGRFDVAISEPGGGKVSQPVGITVDAANRLWIADTGHHRLLVVASAGRLVERIELPPLDDEHPCDPTDLVVTADGKRTYIVDNDNHRVLIRDNASGAFTALGRFGSGLGQFRWPFMICIAPDRYVYATEAIGARVQRISPADLWAGQVSRWGVELGQLYRPKGVAVDRQGELYVSDSTLGVVQVFSPLSRLEGVLTDARGKPLRFDHPMGLCFDAGGRLYVVELRAHRVAVVALGGKSPAASRHPADRKGGGQEQ